MQLFFFIDLKQKKETGNSSFLNREKWGTFPYSIRKKTKKEERTLLS